MDLFNFENFIEIIKSNGQFDETIYGFIKNIDDFKSVMLEIDSNIIGGSELKDYIVNQIATLSKHYTSNGNIKEIGMNNLIISGPPGVGKTFSATLLAKLWSTIFGNKYEENVSEKKTDLEVFCIKKLNKISKDAEKLCEKILEMKVHKGKNEEIKEKIHSFLKNLKEQKFHMALNIKIPQNEEISEFKEVKEDESGIEIDTSLPYVILTRADLIGRHVGETTYKVRLLLDSLQGKTVIVDEAYSLVNGDKDFGFEALTEICHFMTSKPSAIRWIFCGYKEEIEERLFSKQPGLSRRFKDVINITKYSPEDLTDIFLLKIQSNEHRIEESDIPQIYKIFEENAKYLKFYGGDIEELCQRCIAIAGRNMLHQVHNKDNFDVKKFDIIKVSFLETALEQLKKKDRIKEEQIPYFMYC